MFLELSSPRRQAEVHQIVWSSRSNRYRVIRSIPVGNQMRQIILVALLPIWPHSAIAFHSWTVPEIPIALSVKPSHHHPSMINGGARRPAGCGAEPRDRTQTSQQVPRPSQCSVGHVHTIASGEIARAPSRHNYSSCHYSLQMKKTLSSATHRRAWAGWLRERTVLTTLCVANWK